MFLTNCPEALVTGKEVVVLYRVRWQIELLFKLWKSHNRLASHRTTDPVRQMVELYARLTAAVLQHWLMLTVGWLDERISLVKLSRCLRELLPLVIAALGQLDRLIETLTQLASQLAGLARVNSRRKDPSTCQLLTDPELLTYEA